VKTPPPALAQRLVGASEEVLRPDRELRLEDVAALIGAARATLYYYFGGRDDLIAFLLEEHLTAAAEAIHAAVHADESPGARLRSAVAALVEFLGDRPGVCAGLLSTLGPAAGRMRAILTAKDAMIAAPFRDILEEGHAAGLFSIDDPRDATSAVLGAAMISTLDRWHRGEDATPAFQRTLTDQIVRGVQGDKGPEPA
jgi:AcrR family transcriptional regulator